MQTLVREYKNRQKFQGDAKKLYAKGYRVASTMEKQHKMGCIRFILGGFLFGRRKTTIIVTYEKEE